MWIQSLGPSREDSPGGGHGSPLQYSCLENPMDRGAWWPMVLLITFPSFKHYIILAFILSCSRGSSIVWLDGSRWQLVKFDFVASSDSSGLWCFCPPNLKFCCERSQFPHEWEIPLPWHACAQFSELEAVAATLPRWAPCAHPVSKRFTVLVVTVDPDHHEGLVLLLHSGLWVQRSMFEFREFIEFVQASGSEINKKVFLQGQIVNIFSFAETRSLLQLLSSTEVAVIDKT